MNRAFYLDSSGIDELSSLYAKALASTTEGLVWYAPARLDGNGSKHMPLPAFDPRKAGLSLRAALYGRSNISGIQPTSDDAVHLFGWSSLFVVPKSWTTTRPVKAYITRIPADLPSAAKYKLVSRAQYIQLVVPSKTIADALISWGVPAEKIEQRLPIIPPITTIPPAFKFLTTPGFLVGVICPLAPDQGLEAVIQAIQLSTEIIPDLKVFIIGDGPDKRRFQWLLDQTHLKERVHIAANAADYQRFLQHLEICIAPAVYDEGCDPIILQARHRGLAVIATDIPSHAEFIEHGKTGLLYAPGNSHMLSQHLINLYTHRDWLQHYKKQPA